MISCQKPGEKANIITVAWAGTICSDPAMLSISVRKSRYSHDIIKDTGEFVVNLVTTELTKACDWCGVKSGRDVDKFDESFNAKDYRIAENDIPYITKGTNAYFSLEVKESVDLGSHTLFICEPVMMEVLSDAASCTYEYYQKNIKPKPQPVGKTATGKTVWRCTGCGYEREGEELPDDFICPICKHPKADFEKIIR